MPGTARSSSTLHPPCPTCRGRRKEKYSRHIEISSPDAAKCRVLRSFAGFSSASQYTPYSEYSGSKTLASMSFLRSSKIVLPLHRTPTGEAETLWLSRTERIVLDESSLRSTSWCAPVRKLFKQLLLNSSRSILLHTPLSLRHCHRRPCRHTILQDAVIFQKEPQ